METGPSFNPEEESQEQQEADFEALSSQILELVETEPFFSVLTKEEFLEIKNETDPFEKITRIVEIIENYHPECSDQLTQILQESGLVERIQ